MNRTMWERQISSGGLGLARGRKTRVQAVKTVSWDSPAHIRFSVLRSEWGSWSLDSKIWVGQERETAKGGVLEQWIGWNRVWPLYVKCVFSRERVAWYSSIYWSFLWLKNRVKWSEVPWAYKVLHDFFFNLIFQHLPIPLALLSADDLRIICLLVSPHHAQPCCYLGRFSLLFSSENISSAPRQSWLVLLCHYLSYIPDKVALTWFITGLFPSLDCEFFSLIFFKGPTLSR